MPPGPAASSTRSQPQGRRGARSSSTPGSPVATGRRSSSWPSTSAARRTPSSAASRSAGGPTGCSTEEAGFDPEDVILDPNIFAIGDRHRRARRLCRRPTSRPSGGSRPSCPARASRAGSATSRSRSGATSRVREAIHAVFLYHAIAAGMDMGIVNAGPARHLRRHRAASCGSGSRTSSWTADPTPPSGSSRSPQRARRAAGVERPGPRPGVSVPVGERLVARPRRGDRRPHRRGHRGGAARGRAPDRGDRGPAHGRHERGGRPLRSRAGCSCPRSSRAPGS